MSERRYGDEAGPCDRCGGDETHVSFEDITANYCRNCGHYFRDDLSARPDSAPTNGES